MVGAILVASTGNAGLAQPSQPADPDQLLRDAEALGKSKQYASAIELYKRADHIKPRAANACHIGLAYLRSAAWSQAELAFDSCRSRATDDDPAPRWIDKAQAELDKLIRDARMPAVTFVVRPEGAAARLAMVGWPADESFAPRTLHLPIGAHRVDATSSGRTVRTDFTITGPTLTVEINVTPPPAPIDLSAAAKNHANAASKTPDADSAASRKRPSRVLGYSLIGAGGVAVAVGAVSHVLAARDRARMETSAEAWDANRAAFSRERVVAIAGYSVGAALVAAGTYWLLRTPERNQTTAIAPLVSDQVMGLTLEWSH